MSASTATADTPLRQAWLRYSHSQAGRLAPQDLYVLFQVRLGPSGLRVLASRRSRGPVSHGVLAVSSRIAMNNVG